MVCEVPSVMVYVFAPPVKSGVSDSCSSNFDVPIGPLTKMRKVLPAGTVDGPASVGLVAAAFMVTVAVVLSVGPHELVARTQNFVVAVSGDVISIDGKLKYSSEPRIAAMACSSLSPSSDATSAFAPLRRRNRL